MPAINREAEQYLLGCVLREGELIKELNVRPEHFYFQDHRKIFEAMKGMEREEEAIDLPSVTLRLLDQMDNLEYLVELNGSIPSVEPYRTYEKYVMEAWKLRMAELVANKIKSGVEGSRGDVSIISDSIQDLLRLEEIGHEEDFDLKELLMEIQEEMDQDIGDLTGIDTGYRDMNQFTSGWQDQDLIIVAARPSVGKTAFALNMAERAANQGVVTSIFSLEMSKKLLMRRILCSVGRIDATKMRNPKRLFGDNDWNKAQMALGIVSRFPLHIYDKPSVTVQDIRAKLRRLKRQFPDKKHICFIDYLTLIKGSGGENRVQEVGDITRQLKIIAREFEIPMVVLAQLSRSVEQRQDKRPMMSDLRDSGEIEQHADIIAFLYRDDYYYKDTEQKNIIEIIIAKQRNGATGTVKLAFMKEYNLFLDLETDRDHG